MKQLLGIIPAAGAGTRLLPYNVAKELLPVGSQRILVHGRTEERPKIASQYVIEAMAQAGVRQIIVVTHPSKCNLMALHLDGHMYGVHICYIVQTPRSMAHSIDLAYEWAKESTVVMGMPDTIVSPHSCFQQLLQLHGENNADLSLGLFPTDKPHKFGMIKTDGDSNVIYHEDKPSHTDASSMWGIAVWEPSFTDMLHEYVQQTPHPRGETVLGDIFDAMMARGKLCKAYPIRNGKYYDIGTYDDYKRAIAEL